MTNREIAQRLREITKELDIISNECMFNNHENNERVNGLMQQMINGSSIHLSNVAFYIENL